MNLHLYIEREREGSTMSFSPNTSNNDKIITQIFWVILW